MKKIFGFNEEAMCPECGKTLDDCPARDFVIFDMNNRPVGTPTSDRCGWCDVYYTATPISGDRVQFDTR